MSKFNHNRKRKPIFIAIADEIGSHRFPLLYEPSSSKKEAVAKINNFIKTYTGTKHLICYIEYHNKEGIIAKSWTILDEGIY